MTAPTDLTDRYRMDGFIGPVPVLDRRECRALRRHLAANDRPAPAEWHKGLAATDHILFEIASSERLIALLTPILGDNIILWGCDVARRGRGAVHPWHVDIESSAGAGGFATVWLGVANVNAASTPKLIAGSHQAGATIQQVQAERGFARGAADDARVLGWARERVPDAWLAQPAARDGDAILFDGRIWHGSRNRQRFGSRTALLLHYAAADSAVRMPDFSQVVWPFRFHQASRPPVLVVKGSAGGPANRIVPPPVRPNEERSAMMSSCIRSIDMPLAENKAAGWQPYRMFNGATRCVDKMGCHVSVLSPGHCPHPPHAHDDEELLIVIDGEAELVIADSPDAAGARIEPVERGDFIYYPAHQHHTIRNTGTAPVTYMMFRWSAEKGAPAWGGRAKDGRAKDRLETMLIRRRDRADPDGPNAFATRKLFEQATEHLGKLHCHATRIAPGGGYDAHVDAYDVAIVLQAGEVETLGQSARAPSVIYCSAGEMHGMKNSGDAPAHYLVFEFHRAERGIARWAWRGVRRQARRARSIAGRVKRRVLGRAQGGAPGGG